jgi:hypothetical protein
MDTLQNRLPLDRARYLFIYLVMDEQAATTRFCTVVTYGRSQAEAERVAINCVHQQGLRILRTDTATEAPWLDPACDRDYLDELERFGSALRLGELIANATAA